MKTAIFRTIVLAMIGLAFLAGQALAQDENPNGFISGPHYNLNIHGKKEGFVCPPAIDPDTGLYGKSIFVPENGIGIQIYMQSGKGTKAAAIPDLQAIDPCAVFDGNGAVIQLPKNEAGYRVFARALAKPTDEPYMTVIPSLVMVQDELGNDLVYLGLVTTTGFLKADGTFIRKPGRSKAQEITGMFEWTGEVCYFTDPGGDYTPSQICCIDADSNGIYEDCEPASSNEEGFYCATEGYEVIPTYCHIYEEPEWVFNIGDFVEYLWTADNYGLKLLQVRFYPN